MTFRVGLRDEAREDIEAAATWYETQKTTLGQAYLDEVQATFEALAERPLAYPQVYKAVRRALLQRFPYGIFYRFDGQSVLVIAVMHARRDTSPWRGRE
jgi:plasmid stabilization system protein ParE